MRVDTGRLRIVAESRGSVASSAAEARGVHAVGELKLGTEDDPPLPGAYIRAQRKRLGMSLDQLAAQTKIPRRQLELLEDDRYGELPGLVFVKGFLRCCARALGLDPEAVIGLLYEREREQLRAKRRENSGVGVQVPAEFGKHRRSNRASRWLATRLDRLPSAQILMWLIIGLIVALIVLAAFTLASGQAAEALQIRS